MVERVRDRERREVKTRRQDLRLRLERRGTVPSLEIVRDLLARDAREEEVVRRRDVLDLLRERAGALLLGAGDLQAGAVSSESLLGLSYARVAREFSFGQLESREINPVQRAPRAERILRRA